MAMAWLSLNDRFDAAFYCRNYPDVVDAGLPPLLHYILHGQAEGRSPHAATTSSPGKAKARPDTKPALYIVPAFMGNRNTKRYRANHLAEVCESFAQVCMIDFKAPPEGFFSDVRKSPFPVVLQRLSAQDPASMPFLHTLKKTGCRILYDIDDLLFDREQLEDWRLESWDIPPASYLDIMAYADAFLAATPELANRLQVFYHKDADVVPNVLNRQQLAASAQAYEAAHANAGRFIIGYAAGSASHDHDLTVALPAIEQFLSEHPDAELHCIGDVRIPESMTKRLPTQIMQHAKVPWFDLPAALASFDIQIIPLTATPFNACKSHIRFLESAAVRVPTLCSNVGQQAQSVTEGITGLLTENSTEGWHAGLRRYYENSQLRFDIAEAAYRYMVQSCSSAAPDHIARTRELLGKADNHTT